MKTENVEIAVDHNFHLKTQDVMKKWEERRSLEYKDYRLQWYNNPKNNISLNQSYYNVNLLPMFKSFTIYNNLLP